MMEIPLDNLWSQVLERLQLELSRPTFETWIEQLENNCLIIRTPNPFARNWLQKYYINTIAHVVQDILGYPVEIYITVAQGDEVSQLGKQEVAWELPAVNPIFPNVAKNQQKTTELNSKYVFSRFVVGANNRMAHAASLAVAEYPGREFNYNCGKTITFCGKNCGKLQDFSVNIFEYNYSVEKYPGFSTSFPQMLVSRSLVSRAR